MKAIKALVRRAIKKFGYDIRRIPPTSDVQMTDDVAYARLHDKYFKRFTDLAIDKAHYGCGVRLLADGWVNIEYAGYGNSAHEELCNLDSRPGQEDLNMYAELVK